VTFAVPLSSPPANTRNVKLRVPFTFGAAVYVQFAPLPLNTPSEGKLLMKKSIGPPSGLLACRVIATDVSSAIVTELLIATGESCTGNTVSVTVAGAEVAAPSEAV